jgi:formylglycine-generating enzyme required for sulfatase activity
MERTSTVDGMMQVYIPEGKFKMGEDSAQSDNAPMHTVYLDAYLIDRIPVTNTMYARCVEAGKCTYDVQQAKTEIHYGNPDYADHPVVYVTWFQAADYCLWAGRRLPMEAEWEKAARGTDARRYPWGLEAIDPKLANFNNLIGDTTPAGSYPLGASPYGVLDMAGNVRQWIADWYSAFYYASSPKDNPQGPASGEKRVLRGGAFDDPPNSLRTTTRFAHIPGSSGFNRGFRCAATP